MQPTATPSGGLAALATSIQALSQRPVSEATAFGGAITTMKAKLWKRLEDYAKQECPGENSQLIKQRLALDKAALRKLGQIGMAQPGSAGDGGGAGLVHKGAVVKSWISASLPDVSLQPGLTNEPDELKFVRHWWGGGASVECEMGPCLRPALGINDDDNSPP